MPIMNHPELGEHFIEEHRVKKLLKRGWEIGPAKAEPIEEEEPEMETNTPDELDENNEQGEA